MEPCAFCGAKGFVHVEHVIHGSVEERVHECKACGKRWVAAKVIKERDA